MLKKTLFFTLLFSACSSSFAKDQTATLIVMPYRPLDWVYHNATIAVNQPVSTVDAGITLFGSVGDSVSLIDVSAINAHPKIDEACLHLHLHEGINQLSFELKTDWLVHCQFS